MLRVVRVPETGRYSNEFTQTLLSGGKTWFFQPLIGPFASNSGSVSIPSLVTEIDGIIGKASEKDVVGDRAVSHHQVSGQISFSPLLRGKVTSTSQFQKYSLTMTGGGTATYTHAVLPGESVVLPVDTAAKLYYFCARFDSASRSWVAGMGSVRKTDQVFSGTLTSYQLSTSGKQRRKKSLSYTSLDVFLSLPIADMSTISYVNINLLSPTSCYLSDAAIEAIVGISTDSFQSRFVPDEIPEQPFVWSDLCQSCIDQLRFTNVNTLSYVSELREIKSLGEALIGAISKNPKKIAQGYLAFHYGATLTVKDTQALAQAIIDAKKSIKDLQPWRTTQGSRTFTGTYGPFSYTDTYHYKVSTTPQDLVGMEAVRLLDSWGFYPTPQRLWDMVPLSFVLDWFVKISDFLGRCDSDMLRGFYNVLAVCWSRKVVVDLPVSLLFGEDLNVSGSILVTSYNRVTSKKLHPIAFRIERAGEFHNYLEGLALIIARKN